MLIQFLQCRRIRQWLNTAVFAYHPPLLHLAHEPLLKFGEILGRNLYTQHDGI